MTPDAVLFDLDSTLCRSTRDDRQLHAEAFARAGVEPFCTPEDVREVASTITDADTDHEFFRQVFERAAARAGAEPVDAEALAGATVELRDPTAVEWRPGAKVALERARERAQVGLVTNGTQKTQRAKLDTLGIADAFETIVYAPDQTDPKPSPAPFETALAELDVSADSTLYVGNDYRADVIGAKRAGLAACWVPSETDLDAPEDPAHAPDYRFDSTEELTTVF
ncbi:HAD family hydrolase [Halapricum hydrolyticum]|uniref:HAD family hydrolase n=1 Tax=Halapricum hydrolyticum TaxID=2979991 RepID=A0AAE3IBZ0_9EURY|nr:HAD family hydrolase [Halapricum hydrolyticum]MCU4717835.1 HAD family hydrolase [Halapricum hydrolyticum]MCU4726999.1 HAD family hydrolase [Halapricum hydrolyticum]